MGMKQKVMFGATSKIYKPVASALPRTGLAWDTFCTDICTNRMIFSDFRINIGIF
jgi:hypothetical protein